MRCESVDALIREFAPDRPVVCLRIEALECAARDLTAAFPGDVLYAVKCNPEPAVLRALHRGGVHHYDTASLAEVALVRGLFGPGARAYFNHPVKARSALREAAATHGVDRYVVDCEAELDKVAEVVGPSGNVSVRLATPRGAAVQHMSSKFGATPEEAARLLRKVAARGFHAGLAFHVGSQCRDPGDFYRAIEIAGRVRAAAGVPLADLNVGGGLPAPYVGDPVPPVSEFVSRISEGVRAFGFSDCSLQCEPGRALVVDGCSILTQVHLRKGRKLYINDGIFGGLCELVHLRLRVPVRTHRAAGFVPGPARGFTLYGPTCDPVDEMPGTWTLPEGIREGDWIEFGQIGAYSSAITTRFNGFATDTFAEVEEFPFWLEQPAAAAELRTA